MQPWLRWRKRGPARSPSVPVGRRAGPQARWRRRALRVPRRLTAGRPRIPPGRRATVPPGSLATRARQQQAEEAAMGETNGRAGVVPFPDRYKAGSVQPGTDRMPWLAANWPRKEEENAIGARWFTYRFCSFKRRYSLASLDQLYSPVRRSAFTLSCTLPSGFVQRYRMIPAVT